MSEIPEASKPARAPRDQARLIAAAVLGGVAVALGLANLDSVKISWVFGSTHLPLVILIALVFLLGAAADRALVTRRKRRGAVE